MNHPHSVLCGCKDCEVGRHARDSRADSDYCDEEYAYTEFRWDAKVHSEEAETPSSTPPITGGPATLGAIRYCLARTCAVAYSRRTSRR